MLGGDVVSPELSARLERGGGKKLRRLIERGWVAGEPGAWTLTDEGRGFGPRGFDHGHGRPGFGHGRPGFGPHGERAGESASHGHCEHGHRGHGHEPHRHADRAFERGFNAGFSRGAASRDA
ncbi:MAG: hypothetical protein LBE44_02405 [Microbacterium hominis]|uniref:hypothetical protein n=1 Tax=Microbacterium aurum TaxID=36805 RepID=UPI00248E4F46|nr:hypothetical protein [Microbacterium aurum]MBZ6370760.1 hypothetical protein [Microbacterium hominis]